MAVVRCVAGHKMLHIKKFEKGKRSIYFFLWGGMGDFLLVSEGDHFGTQGKQKSPPMG